MQVHPINEVRQLLQAIFMGANEPSPELLARLSERLISSDEFLRELIVAALCELGADAVRVLDILQSALHDPNERVARRACRAIGEIGPASARVIPKLVQCLKERPEAVGREVISALGRIGPAAAHVTPELMTFLNHSDARFRAITTVALTNMGDATIPYLLQGLRHPDSIMRARVIRILGRLGPLSEATLQSLRQATQDPDADVAQAAQESLALAEADLL